MPAPDTRNARIALAQGWTYRVIDPSAPASTYGLHESEPPEHPGLAYWYDPQNRHCPLRDWVGTLEGVAELMRELGSEWERGAHKMGFACFRGLNAGPDEFFTSPHTRLGDCVGDAWLSVFEKEDADAS